jgi:hypothetical protein
LPASEGIAASQTLSELFRRAAGGPGGRAGAMSRADIFAVAFVLGGAINTFPQDSAEMITQQTTASAQRQTHRYEGMWLPPTDVSVTTCSRTSATTKREATGKRLSQALRRARKRHLLRVLWDDTGFTADDKFVDDVLYHAGMILHRKS